MIEFSLVGKLQIDPWIVLGYVIFRFKPCNGFMLFILSTYYPFEEVAKKWTELM